MRLFLFFILLLLVNCARKTKSASVNVPLNTDTSRQIQENHEMQTSVKVEISEKKKKGSALENHIVVNNGIKEADASFQWEANQKLEKLLRYYGKNLPGYYGGAVIGESGNLIVNIKGDLPKGKKAVTNIIGDKNVVFKSTKFSKAELDGVMDVINRRIQLPENKNILDNFGSASVMEDNGQIEIGLLVVNSLKIKQFKDQISDSPTLIFIKGGRLVNQ